MANPSQRTSDGSSEEFVRVTQQLAARLRARGVDVRDSDSGADLGSLLEAVEAFEAAVEARGGDLMVDEPPEGHDAEPDNPEFVLPERRSKESVNDYSTRINAAAVSLHR